MPGIFDVLAANGILSSLFGGQPPSTVRGALDTGDDTERMRKRPTGVGSVTNPTPPVPLMLQAMENDGVPVANPAATSFLPPDAQQAMAQAEIDPRTIPSGPDPYANTYNTTATNAEDTRKAIADSSKPDYGWADALIDAGRGLMIAGSPDPAKASAMFADAWANERAARKPKVTPLQNGAFSLITNPDGSTRVVRNDEVAQFIRDTSGDKLLADLIKIDRRGQVDQNNKTVQLTNKDLIDQAGGVDAPLEFRGTVTTQLGKIDNLLGAVRGIDTVAGYETPFIANIIDQTYGRVTGSNSYSFRRDLETLVNKDVLSLAAEMKGALSDKDVTFLKSIQPRADDPVDRKLAYLNELKSRLQAGEERRIEAAKSLRERGVTGQSGTSQDGQATASQPAPKQNNQGSDLSSQAASAFGAYEPNVYEYRINNGVLQRRKK